MFERLLHRGIDGVQSVQRECFRRRRLAVAVVGEDAMAEGEAAGVVEGRWALVEDARVAAG